MSGRAEAGGTGLLSAAQLRPVQIDELSNIRYLHASSVRRLAASHLSEGEIEALAAYLYSDAYSARLAELVRARHFIAATLGPELVATAGWITANDSGSTARLMAIFVSPLYPRCGLGRIVVTAVEQQAAQAGFRTFTIRTPVGATGFFLQLGYEISSHGVWTLGPDQTIPVSFLRKHVPPADEARS